jgi:hypothetical protein
MNPMIELYVKTDRGDVMRWKNEDVKWKELRNVEKEVCEIVIDGKESHSYVAIYDLRNMV